MKLPERAEDTLRRWVPEHTQGGIKRYIEHGIEPGSFLYGVFCNDLKFAIGHADAINFGAIKEIMSWVYNYAPAECWGSPEKVNTWIEMANEQLKEDAPDDDEENA